MIDSVFWALWGILTGFFFGALVAVIVMHEINIRKK